MTRKTSAGFTFIELAISIVIIGLITGGILVARDLNRQAKLRGVSADLARYEAAVVGFRDKYAYYPGDFPTATNIWGSAGGTGSDAACQDTASTTLTCNGNGDGIILTSATTFDETARAWQHLQNAELLDTGVFRGTLNGVTTSQLTRVALPAAKLDGVGYQFVYESRPTEGWNGASLPTAEIGVIPQTIRVALPNVGAPAPARLGANAFTPQEMFSMDEKFDDKRPGMGKIYVQYDANCVNGGNSVTAATYKSTTTISCYFYYSLAK